jgi:hypothetical protein
MNASMTSLALFFESEPGSNASRYEGAVRKGLLCLRKRFLLWACIVLSLMVHGLGVWLVDFRPVHHLILDKLEACDSGFSRAFREARSGFSAR